MSWIWIFKMAWRDSRSNRRKLFLYMAAIIVGVAAQVAITSFRVNLNQSINDQAKELLGADLQIQTSAVLDNELADYLDSLSSEQAKMIEFNSMAFFPKNSKTRLSQIMALEPLFPFYGVIETNPKESAFNYNDRNGALIDQSILQQFNIQIGDSVNIGFNSYEIVGSIIDIPGQSAANSFFGPRIIVPFNGIENSGLLERGSRLEYTTFVKYPFGTDSKLIVQDLNDMQNTLSFGFDDVAERREEVGEAISYLSNFLNLIGFIALLLGGIGVASSIFVYVRQKIPSIAVLRCMGASSNQTMFIFLIQASLMGSIGSLIGAITGTLIQLYIPVLVKDFIPVDINLFISWTSIFIGILTGILISVLFALIPLLAVRKISPLFTLRTAQVDLLSLLNPFTRLTLFLVITSGIISYAWVMLLDIQAAIFFTGGLLVCLLILSGFALLVIRMARKFIPSSWNYEWRQGLANLYRPNNQTSTLLLTFGLGVTLISSLYLTQDLLLGTINFEDEAELPNLAMFDIQYDQNDGVNEIINENGIEILQNVPIVTMRLQSLKGRTVQEILNDTSRIAQKWTLNREYRSTYRDSLINTETLSEGNFIGEIEMNQDIVPISVEAGLMEDLNASLGDTIVWDVQGIPITSYISSTRLVNWQTPQPNFFVVFPKGVLEPAPQFFATTVNTPSKEASLNLQRDVVIAYPNVSAIDVGQIVGTIRAFLDRITFVIQFIGLFSIITGLIVLASSAATSRYQRIRESVLLRTLGAKQIQVIKIQIIEYAFLGILAAFIGLSLSISTSWLIGYFYFGIEFIPNFRILGIEIAFLVIFVLLIGLLNTRGIHAKPPLEILRQEG
jgi:putative ABC transport system permease protein